MSQIWVTRPRRDAVDQAIRQANGNQTHAAKLLDVSRDALRYQLRKLG